jgi:proline dehydrogenase
VISRRLLLAASRSAWLRERAATMPFVRRAVSAFMPGERLEDALGAAQQLRAEGISTMLTRLGENVTTGAEAREVTAHYLDVLDRIRAAGLDAHISIKPTQLGLDVDPELCARNLTALVTRASERKNFVWIDMESSPYVDRTLSLFELARRQSSAVGVALQAYLLRTQQDIDTRLPAGSAIRLVKGAYLEPADVAFRRKRDVDENYYRLACRLLTADSGEHHGLLQIATHDGRLISRLEKVIGTDGVHRDAYEYAMLYGIRVGLQRQHAQAGARVRVLISYGDYWFPWYMRRLAERPANVWFLLKSLYA